MVPVVIRIEKIKTRQGIGQRQAHNDRSKDTPNADEARRDLNQEYLNVEGQPIVKLVDKRMAEAGLGKPREGAVLCVEVLMTAGPAAEIWQRDAKTGQAADMRGSEWEKQTLAWAKREWGDNLVALKLHQDEKTPHFQGFVVPILGKGGGLAGEVNLEQNKGARLSARDMFSPVTLSQLQTDFAEAMQPFGLERGIKGSRTPHKTMREMYALGGEKAAELAPLVAPVEPQPFALTKPPLIGREEWQREKQAEINAEIARQVGEVNERLGAVGAMAVAASGAAEQSEHSRAWAGDSLQKADEARNKLAEEISQRQADRERHAAEFDKLLIQIAQGNLPADLLQRGQDLVAQQLEDLRQAWPVVATLRVQEEQAERAGDYGLVADLRYGKIPEAEQQLAHYREQAQATPAGRALLAELEEGDRVAVARALAQAEAQQAAETREKERVAEQERAAQQQRAAEQEARKAQQQAIEDAAAASKEEVAEQPQGATSWAPIPQADSAPAQIFEQPGAEQEEEEELDM